MLSIGAGTGLLYLLRWFWWRINAWSEIAAMASSFLLAVAVLVLQQQGQSFSSPVSLVVTVALTTVVWLTATWLTRPTDRETLHRFYRLVRPAGPGWAEVRAACGGLAPADDLRAASVGTVAACVGVYSALFGTGHWLMGHTTSAAISGVLLVAATFVTIRAIVRLWQ